MTYTQLAVGSVVAVVLIDLWVLRTRMVTRAVFWTSYAIIFFFQLVTNGMFTGFGVVKYDGESIIGRHHFSARDALPTHPSRTSCSASH